MLVLWGLFTSKLMKNIFELTSVILFNASLITKSGLTFFGPPYNIYTLFHTAWCIPLIAMHKDLARLCLVSYILVYEESKAV